MANKDELELEVDCEIGLKFALWLLEGLKELYDADPDSIHPWAVPSPADSESEYHIMD